MTGYKGDFKMKWWPWYLVDLRNWHKPVIVRKHFQNKEIAIDYSHRWLSSDFQPIKGYEAIEMGLKDGVNYKWKNSHRTRDASKYHFPKDCITQKDKELFRLRQRRKLSRMKRLPDLTYKDILYMLEKNPSRFCIRTKIWKNWNYAYSLPTPNIGRYIKAYKWPNKVNICVIIEKTLIHYNYDIGLWPMWVVVRELYGEYGKLIHKLHTGISDSEYWAWKEHLARGFTNELKVPKGEYSVVKSKDGLKWQLYWPEYGRLGSDKGDNLLQIYELQSRVSIPGYTGVQLSKKYGS